MIPYSTQKLTRMILKVVKTLRSPFLTQGPKVLKFEKQFANIVNAKYAATTNSATGALYI